MSQAEFPPAPWRLRGDMWVSLWRLPPERLPRWRLPSGSRPVTVAGSPLLLTAWANYRTGGVLAYHEFLTVQVVASRRRLAGVVTQAWVDSLVSRRGGRALWEIPKDLAEIGICDNGQTMSARLRYADRDVTSGWRLTARLPGRWRLRGRLAQPRPDGGPLLVGVELTSRLAVGTARFECAPDGPLGFLTGRQPLLTIALRDFRLVVGGTRPGAGRRR